MPLFEFNCKKCNKTFEKLLKQKDKEALCPMCGSRAEKAVSVFAASSCSAPAGSGFG